MKILDPGHVYELSNLDGKNRQRLVFVKRKGAGYPGNIGSHEGTNCQEVFRVLIARLEYLNMQNPCDENIEIVELSRRAIRLLEKRAARQHRREFSLSVDGIERLPACVTCGHIGCLEGHA